MTHSYAAISSTIKRTFQLWFFSNVGGTLFLAAQFALDRLTDYSIALMAGVVAAMISLCVVPLVIPFFTLMGRFYAAWSRRSMALAGVGLFYVAANQLLLLFLPFDSLGSLLGISFPYLAAALLTVMWLYGPALHSQPRA
ncbi:hypothetical protein [Hymenobacter algoricola]|uniref:Uncharacterized protein n=1 Tax=Hymenobacter algoricola TaxID=486267 RepID=A0ABP7NUJ5_9BACT